jgi:hypothetical protein
VVAGTLAFTGRPVRPLLDGLVPPPPYRWVKPPPGLGVNTKPQRAEVTVALGPAGSELAGPSAINGQVILNLPAGAMSGRAGDREVRITIDPLDPARGPALPSGFVADGNAYRIGLRARPSGDAVTSLAAPGNIILATPEPASVLLYAADGGGWEALPTQRVGGPDSVGGPFRGPGRYVAAIPGVARAAAEPAGWVESGRRVLIVILSLALVGNLAWRARQRRRPAQDM